ncbi:hypothetical protein CBM2626_B110137 [Cupriavidus taiwanensis]|nr:hypothetical protein CBM2626_B110137 [Cupriavidus taiwanensis]
MAKHRERSLPSQLAFPVVGIGASAGGIEALIEIFEGLPSTTGAAYVLVIHLSPDHASHLADLLQARSSMRVQQVTTSTPIEANQVYVIAPNHNLTMVDGYLRVTPQERSGAAARPTSTCSSAPLPKRTSSARCRWCCRARVPMARWD